MRPQVSGSVDEMVVESSLASSTEGEVAAGTNSPASEPMDTTKNVPTSQVNDRETILNSLPLDAPLTP